MASILGSMARGGKKLIKDTAKNLADKKELKKLKKEDYPSEKQKTRIKELENKINKDKKKEAVKKMINENNLLGMGIKSRLLVENSFSEDIIFSQIEDIYKQ